MPNYNGDGLSISWRCLCCRFSVVPLVPHLPGGTRGREAGAELAWVRRPRASPPSGAPSWGPIRASSATKSGLPVGGDWRVSHRPGSPGPGPLKPALLFLPSNGNSSYPLDCLDEVMSGDARREKAADSKLVKQLSGIDPSRACKASARSRAM